MAKHGRRLLVDSMSAFGALEIDARQIRYDALAFAADGVTHRALGGARDQLHRVHGIALLPPRWLVRNWPLSL